MFVLKKMLALKPSYPSVPFALLIAVVLSLLATSTTWASVVLALLCIGYLFVPNRYSDFTQFVVWGPLLLIAMLGLAGLPNALLYVGMSLAYSTIVLCLVSAFQGSAKLLCPSGQLNPASDVKRWHWSLYMLVLIAIHGVLVLGHYSVIHLQAPASLKLVGALLVLPLISFATLQEMLPQLIKTSRKT